jgi:hypothetical protein
VGIGAGTMFVHERVVLAKIAGRGRAAG